MSLLEQLEFFFRGAGVSILALACIQMAIRYRHTLAGRLGIAFCICSACYLMCRPVGVYWEAGWWGLPVYLGCFSSSAIFWMLSRAWFDDGFRLRWHHLALLLVLNLAYVRNFLLPEWVPEFFGIRPPDELVEIRELFPRLISIGFVLAALIQAQFGRADDLIEARRRFRDRLVIVVGGWMVVVAAVEIYLLGKGHSMLLETGNMAAITAMLLVIMAYGMRMRDGLFPQPVAGPGPAKPANGQQPDQALLDALDRFIQDEQGYRQPGLTIAALADALKAPEYRLRRAINGHLGHRNFSDFLNGHRIADARAQLTDPDKARLPVLTIAMDVGFNSLGPFNRAFKAETGVTPVEYRQQAGTAATTEISP
jgi:AraC-like DNA-binding protein